MEHPLWQLYLIDGLRGGRHAYLSKTHHALVDGVAAVDIGMILLDPKPKAHEVQAARRIPGARRAEARRAVRAGRRLRGAAAVQGRRPRRRPHGADAGARPRQRDPQRRGVHRAGLGRPLLPEEPVQRPHRPRPPRRLGQRPTSTASSGARERGRGIDRQRRPPLDRGRGRCGASSRAAARAARAPGRAGAGQHPPARRGARARQPDLDDPGEAADRRARPAQAAGDPARRDRAAEGVRERPRRLADRRGGRLDAADDQPAALLGDGAAARLQPRRLQRARGRSSRSICWAAGSARSTPTCRSRPRTTPSRSG